MEQDYDISPDQVYLKKFCDAGTQTNFTALYSHAEGIVKNFEKIENHWRQKEQKYRQFCERACYIVKNFEAIEEHFYQRERKYRRIAIWTIALGAIASIAVTVKLLRQNYGC